jgi:hypothetical protein
MLPAEISEMGKPLLTLSMTKTRYKAKASLKICGLFIFGDVISHFCKNAPQIAKTCVVNWIFKIFFLLLTVAYPFVARDVYENARVRLSLCLFILRAVC